MFKFFKIKSLKLCLKQKEFLNKKLYCFFLPTQKIILDIFLFVIVRNTRGFVLYFLMRKYTLVPYIGGISVRYKSSVVQVQVCYTSKVIGPKAHNIIYINSPPQTQGGCETSLRSSTKSRVRPLGSDLVKIFAN